MGALCCHGNQTKRQSTIILANFKGPLPSNTYQVRNKSLPWLWRSCRLKVLLTDGQPDDGQTVITIAHPEHSSGELKIYRSLLPLHKNNTFYWRVVRKESGGRYRQTRGPWWPCNVHLSIIALREPDPLMTKANILTKIHDDYIYKTI